MTKKHSISRRIGVRERLHLNFSIAAELIEALGKEKCHTVILKTSGDTMVSKLGKMPWSIGLNIDSGSFFKDLRWSNLDDPLGEVFDGLIYLTENSDGGGGGERDFKDAPLPTLKRGPVLVDAAMMGEFSRIMKDLDGFTHGGTSLKLAHAAGGGAQFDLVSSSGKTGVLMFEKKFLKSNIEIISLPLLNTQSREFLEEMFREIYRVMPRNWKLTLRNVRDYGTWEYLIEQIASQQISGSKFFQTWPGNAVGALNASIEEWKQLGKTYFDSNAEAWIIAKDIVTHYLNWVAQSPNENLRPLTEIAFHQGVGKALKEAGFNDFQIKFEDNGLDIIVKKPGVLPMPKKKLPWEIELADVSNLVDLDRVLTNAINQVKIPSRVIATPVQNLYANISESDVPKLADALVGLINHSLARQSVSPVLIKTYKSGNKVVISIEDRGVIDWNALREEAVSLAKQKRLYKSGLHIQVLDSIAPGYRLVSEEVIALMDVSELLLITGLTIRSLNGEELRDVYKFFKAIQDIDGVLEYNSREGKTTMFIFLPTVDYAMLGNKFQETMGALEGYEYNGLVFKLADIDSKGALFNLMLNGTREGAIVFKKDVFKNKIEILDVKIYKPTLRGSGVFKAFLKKMHEVMPNGWSLSFENIANLRTMKYWMGQIAAQENVEPEFFKDFPGSETKRLYEEMVRGDADNSKAFEHGEFELIYHILTKYFSWTKKGTNRLRPLDAIAAEAGFGANLLQAGFKDLSVDFKYLGGFTLSATKRDPAMLLKEDVGGVDLTSDAVLNVKQEGEGIKFKVNPAIIEEFRNAPGLVPVIINIQPIKDLPTFLGVQNQDQTLAMV